MRRAPVGWTEPGEWLEYTIDVTTAGTYDMDARVASAGSGGAFHVEMDGVDVSGTLSFSGTGAWETFVTETASVTLAAGEQVMRVVIETGGFNLDHLDFVDPGGGGDCGNGVCDPGEDCNSCSADCDGVTGGKPSNRYDYATRYRAGSSPSRFRIRKCCNQMACGVIGVCVWAAREVLDIYFSCCDANLTYLSICCGTFIHLLRYLFCLACISNTDDRCDRPSGGRLSRRSPRGTTVPRITPWPSLEPPRGPLRRPDTTPRCKGGGAGVTERSA